MDDRDIEAGSAPIPGAGADGRPETVTMPSPSVPVTQSEIDALLNDDQMPVEERSARLQALAERAGVERTDEGTVDPLLLQINEALGFLAGGGHSYAEHEAAEDSDERTIDGERR